MYGRLLHATDFSASARPAFETVRELVEQFHTETHFLHVQEVSRIHPRLKHRLTEFDVEDTRRLQALAAELKTAGSRAVTNELRYDHPVKGILASVEARQPHLVVLGSTRRGHIAELLVGSTAHNVARLSSVPVLLVPRREGTATGGDA